MTWERYKTQISARRKKKWREDPAFRKKQEDRDRQRREILRQALLANRREYYQKRLLAVLEGKGKSKPVEMDDQKYLTTGALAEVVDRTVIRIQQWLREGLLPGYTRLFSNRRLFSVKYVELICDALYETELKNARGDADIFGLLIQTKIAESRMEVCNGKDQGKQKSSPENKDGKSSCGGDVK